MMMMMMMMMVMMMMVMTTIVVNDFSAIGTLAAESMMASKQQEQAHWRDS
jgi:hypothetical protein